MGTWVQTSLTPGRYNVWGGYKQSEGHRHGSRCDVAPPRSYIQLVHFAVDVMGKSPCSRPPSRLSTFDDTGVSALEGLAHCAFAQVRQTVGVLFVSG